MFVIFAYSTALAADTFELSPTVVATNPNAVNLLGQTAGPAHLSDLTGTSDVILEHILIGTSGKYDTIKIFPKHTPEFSLNSEVVVATNNNDGFLFMKNLIVEGDGSNRDGEALTLSSRSLSPNTPYPNPDPYELYLNSIHVNDATLEIKDPNSSGATAIDNGVSIKSIEHLQLDNAAFKIKTGTGSIRFNNANVATLVANSGQNIFEVAGSDLKAVKLDVIIESNAGLTLQNTSTIDAQDGSLQMKSGSSLTLNKSTVILDSPNRSSSLEGATVKLSGTFGTPLANGVGSSHLDLNNPNIKDSTFNLDNNTAFRARGRVLSGTNDGLLNLSDTNVFNLADGAFVTSSGDNSDKYGGSVNVNGGSSSFVSSVAGTRVRQNGLFARQWDVSDGGTLSLERIDGAAGVNFISLSSGSTLRLHTFDNLDNLTSLNVSDSTIESSINRFTSPYIELRNATLKPQKLNSQDHVSITFNGTSPSANSVVLRGTNTIELDITPQGRDITPSIKVYNDEFNIYDSNVTGFITGLSGFNTLNYEIDTQTTGLIAKDYAIGGASGDGRYTVSNLTGSSIDGDNPNISLTPTMPALLQASLDSTPSIDKAVVIKLSELPTSALATLPQVVKSHQAQTITTVVTEPDTGNISTISVTIVPDVAVTPNVSTTPESTITTVVTEPITGNVSTTSVTVIPNVTVTPDLTVTTVVTEPNTGNVVSTTSVTVVPDPAVTPAMSGTTTKMVNTVTTAPDGSLISNTTNTSQLAPATGSKNTENVSKLLANAAQTNTSVASQLQQLTQQQLTDQIPYIHAEPYSSYITVSLEHSDMVMNTVLDHAAPTTFVISGPNGQVEEIQARKRLWMKASYNEGDVNGDNDLGDFDYKLSSLTIGHDLFASDLRTLGMYFSIGSQEMDEHDLAIQNFSGDVYHLGMYLNQANIGGWDIRGVLGYGYGDNSSKRQVILSDTRGSPSANYDSHTAYLGVKGTVAAYQNNWMTLTPELGFNYIYYKQESFKESGDPNLSLKLDSAEAHAVIASAGLSARFASISDSSSIYPLVFARYEHDFYANSNSEHEIDAAIVAHSGYKQSFEGQNRGEHALITGLGLGSDINSSMQINANIVHTENSNGSEWGAGLNFEFRW
ncbi:autotransporter domain-containing protein [Neptunomonas sp.]|uniref:autotransporter family protein n=1 Tax=Neptunomonas sp. TaxID=1971898 RepID=UPI0025F3F8B5|nr:autotransporter domain-containing protein [Neptunomonas sp.]